MLDCPEVDNVLQTTKLGFAEVMVILKETTLISNAK